MARTLLLVALALQQLGLGLALVPFPPIPADKSTPVQQRLAYRDATSISVGWNTFKQLARPTVFYGLSKDALTSNASSSKSVTYPTSRTWSNLVVLNSLKPATTYYYKIDSTNSSIDTFVTARPAGDHTPFTAAAVIDMGLYGKDGVTVPPAQKHLIPRVPPELKHSTIERLVNTANEYDFVFHPGDLAYADDWIVANPLWTLESAQAYESITERFFDQLSLVSRMKPYMVSPGNHEADCVEVPGFPCAKGQKNFSSFRNRYDGVFTGTSALPSSSSSLVTSRTSDSFAASDAGPKKGRTTKRDTIERRATAAQLANPPFWYSYDYGQAHFVMIDTETDLGAGNPGPEEKGGSSGLVEGPFGAVNQQLDFLRADLSSVDRRLTPWVIVAGHRPWYTTGSACTACQKAFEPIFNQYAVDVGVFGHVHNMQIIKPINNGTLDPAGLNNPKAPWYIVNGAAGNIEGLSAVDKAPSYVQWYNDTQFGYSKFVFKNASTLTVQFIQSNNGALLQEATLFKNHDVRFYGS